MEYTPFSIGIKVAQLDQIVLDIDRNLKERAYVAVFSAALGPPTQQTHETSSERSLCISTMPQEQADSFAVLHRRSMHHSTEGGLSDPQPLDPTG